MVASRRRWIGLFIGTVVPCFTGPGQGRVRDGPSAVLPAGWPGGQVMGAGRRTTIGKDQAACWLVTGKWFGKWLSLPRAREAIIEKGSCRDLLEFATGVAIHRSSAGSRSGLAQQQATRRFLAQMKRVRGAAIKARVRLSLRWRRWIPSGTPTDAEPSDP
jgi:hypothetical protein